LISAFAPFQMFQNRPDGLVFEYK